MLQPLEQAHGEFWDEAEHRRLLRQPLQRRIDEVVEELWLSRIGHELEPAKLANGRMA
jgi:hypothetical protein